MLQSAIDPPAAGSFVEVKIRAVAPAAGTALSLSPDAFSMYGRDGTEYAYGSGSAGGAEVVAAVPGELQTHDLRPGQTITGLIVFDAPAHGYLAYQPDGSPLGAWKF